MTIFKGYEAIRGMKSITVYLILISSLSIAVATGQVLDVLTYNIRYDNPEDGLNSWENRKAFLISQLNFFEPDIFGTQEALYHQLTDIKAGMPGYSYIGKGRDDGEEAGEFSAVFYNKAKVELLQEGMFWLSETPEVPSKGWDAAIKRVCTYGLFKPRVQTSGFWVFNSHFDHIGEVARNESVSLILKKIGEINKRGLPVVLMGDLNLEPGHAAIQSLAGKMDDTRIIASTAAFGPEGTFNGFKFEEPVTRRIDYIFTSRGDFIVLKYAVLSDSKDCRYPSDHLPVYARLEFKKKGF